MFGAQCFEKELRNQCSLKRLLLRKIVQLFWPNSLLCWKRIKSIAGFNSVSRPLVVRKQKTVFLQEFGDRIVGRGLWLPRSSDPMPPAFSLRGFLEQRVYCSNPRHLEDLEHNTEQVVAGTDQQTLRDSARNSVKRVNAGL